MSTLTSFKGGLEVVTPSPSGAGGLAINDNFKRLGRLAVELAAGAEKGRAEKGMSPINARER